MTPRASLELGRQVERQVAERLEEERRRREASGAPPLDLVDEQMLSRELVNQALTALRARWVRGEAVALSTYEEDDLAAQVWHRLWGLGRLTQLVAEDASIENVDASGCDVVWVTYADGRRERGPAIAESDADLVHTLARAARRLGQTERRFDTGVPRLDLALPDGNRLFAVMAVTRRPAVSLRVHRHRLVTLDELRELGTVGDLVRDLLSAAVRGRCNIVVCGGTDAGKTTLLRALVHEVPPSERLVTIESNFELHLHLDPERHPNVVELEERQANTEGVGGVSMWDLTRDALRMNPDRVLVGEVRGGEVIPMLKAMSQGNDGSMCTLHADSTQSALSRMQLYAAEAPERLPFDAAAALISHAVDLVVHLAKRTREHVGERRGGRVVTAIREVVGAEASTVVSNEVFAPDADGRATPTGVAFTGRTAARLHQGGFDVRWLLEKAG